MKKLSFLFVTFAVVGFITFSSCKSSTKPAEEPATEAVEEAPAAEQPADTTATAPAAEQPAETPAE